MKIRAPTTRPENPTNTTRYVCYNDTSTGINIKRCQTRQNETTAIDSIEPHGLNDDESPCGTSVEAPSRFLQSVADDSVFSPVDERTGEIPLVLPRAETTLAERTTETPEAMLIAPQSAPSIATESEADALMVAKSASVVASAAGSPVTLPNDGVHTADLEHSGGLSVSKIRPPLSDGAARVIQLLQQRQMLKSREIATELGMAPQEVNGLLFGELKLHVRQDADYRWMLR